MKSNQLAYYLGVGADTLRHDDPMLFSLLERENLRQCESLSLVASSGGTHPSVLAAVGSSIVNVTAEGYPGNRYHSGCKYVDEVETLAIERAKHVFKAQFANVQPHSASFANHAAMHAVLSPGDTILGMALDQGGHLTHGAPANISGRLFKTYRYGLDDKGLIDYRQMRELALVHRPKLIICGTTSYTRAIDFEKVRAIADEAGAYMLADITHIAGLVATGLHQSPIDLAHFTTTCTFKQLYGPRGGLVMMGRDAFSTGPDRKHTLADLIQSSVFPLIQGSPEVHSIAGKACALWRVSQPEFRALARRILDNARQLASELLLHGHEVIGGGTDNHIVLLRVPSALNGKIAAHALESCNILANKNKIPGDTRSAATTSGLRLGTNTVSLRGMGQTEMKTIAMLIDNVLRHTSATEHSYELPEALRIDTIRQVAGLCREFPLPYESPQKALA
jgi:glycine hydroxymethyltransferase